MGSKGDASSEPIRAAIPLHQPHITGNEFSYLAEALASSGVRSDGPFTLRCAQLLEQRFGLSKVLMTPSCTAALELAAQLCKIGPGDEVILPSFTFVSTANAVVRLGARPVFVEIKPETLNLDESRIEAAITPKTRAIFPVHYAGIGCEMNPIMEIAGRHGLKVVEDAAQAVDATYQGRALGSIGHLGTYSFHETKNLISGEGGALCCNDPELLERAEILRDKGTNRARFLRGEVDKYTWVDSGTSAVPSELSCAFLYAQLEVMDQVKECRRAIDAAYRAGLASLECAGHFRLPAIPEGCGSPYHSFSLILESEEKRNVLMAYLRERGVMATFHFVPLHDSPMGRRLGYRPGDLPLTESLAARLLRLPMYCGLTSEDQTRVIELVNRFYSRHSSSWKRQEASLARKCEDVTISDMQTL